MAKAKVYLVGAGPGDINLVTVKAVNLITQADVILYDHLIPMPLLKLAKPNAELVSVGKFAGKHTLQQNKINKLLIEKAKENKTVIRLKGGDPFLFGRGGEEAIACAEASIDFEVIPGVTSALAAPAYAGIPPTHRDYASNLAIITGHKKDFSQIQIPKADTLVFLMSVANIEKIISLLLENGWPQKTKVACIESATCYDQRIIKGTLSDFGRTAKKAKLRTPAVFVVGKVIDLQQKLDWFSRKPRILVLGMHPTKYEHLGYIVHRQIIDCLPLDDYSKLDAAIREINSFDWIVFTSPNGVKFFFQRLHTKNADTRAFASNKIAAIGKTTAEKLKDYGIVPDIVPKNESSEGLLGEFKKNNLENKTILLPRAQIASDILPEGLKEFKAIVTQIPAYNTVELKPEPVNFEYIDQILFTSASIVKAFVKRFAKVPPNVKVYCLGKPTLNEARKHNIKAQILASTCSEELE